MTFEGQWFCYSLHPIANPTLATISGNACKNLVPGSAVVKLADKVIECGFLSNIPSVYVAYLGIYLPAGVKKSATAFRYYDGTSPNPLTWLAGRPNNTITAYTVVYCDKNQLGRVGDANPISLKNLVCKKPVQKGPCPGPLTSTTSSTTSTTTTTTSSTTTTTSRSPKCVGIEDLIAKDAASNSTRLTTALNDAFAGWSRTDKANFAGYKKRIESILWDDSLTVEQKLNMTADVLHGFMPNGTAGQQLLYAVAIRPWGTMCDYVNCARQSADPSYVPQTCPPLPSTSTSTSTTTTTPSPGCKYPMNSTQLGVVVFGEGQTDAGSTEEIGFCDCDVGKKMFYNNGDNPDPFFAVGALMYNLYPEPDANCPDFCLIDEAGTECTATIGTDLQVILTPFCARGKCHMYVDLRHDENDKQSGLVCGSRKFTYRDEWNSADGPLAGGLKPMCPDSLPQVYVHAAAVTCKGCAANPEIQLSEASQRYNDSDDYDGYDFDNGFM